VSAVAPAVASAASAPAGDGPAKFELGFQSSPPAAQVLEVCATTIFFAVTVSPGNNTPALAARQLAAAMHVPSAKADEG